MLEQFETLTINRTFQSVQGHLAISQALHNVLKEHRLEDFQKIERLYHNFTVIEASFFANRLESRYQELQRIYQLPDINWQVATQDLL